MRMKMPCLLLTVCIMLAVLVSNAYAQLNLTLQPAAQNVLAGGSAIFSGTLTNLDSATLFLNGDSNALTGTGLSLSDQLFITDAPLSLAPAGTPGDSWTGDLFTVSSTTNTVPDIYMGSFTVLGGADSVSTNISATAQFSVSVAAQPVPEMSHGLALLFYVACLWFLVRRRRDASNDQTHRHQPSHH